MTVEDGSVVRVWQWTAHTMKRPRQENGNVPYANISVLYSINWHKNYAFGF